jgi:putative heme-binding domain-containing protein
MQRCFACHKAKGAGMEVGPDLVTVKTRGREGILSAILEPHKEVAAQYIAYTFHSKENQTFAGVVTDDNATSVTLKMMGGVAQTLQRTNVRGSSSTGQSLMPEGLEQGMTPQDMADLLAFIDGL